MTVKPTSRLLLAAMLLLGLQTFAPAAFRNTSNKSFASRCNGPQGAIVLRRTTGQVNTLSTARTKAVRNQHNTVKLKRAVASFRRLQNRKLKAKRGQVRFPRVMVETTSAGKLVQTNLTRAKNLGKAIGAATNNLTFTFEGWSTSDQAALKGYLTKAYPKAKLIYGPPAFDMTVKIIQDSTISDVQGGVYNASTNEIHLPPLTGNFPEDTYILMLLVLHAFHDDAMLYYDAWEQGMAGAAAYAVQLTSGVSPGYDIIDPGPFYCLSVYEPQNQPELGNSTFYPASGATNMLVWRIAMARAAWQKCWIENNTFFSDFNKAYYAAYQTSLPGDVPSLKELAAGVLPTVEGTAFSAWYEQQYVLDTSVRTGKKLYTWNIPLTDSVALVTEYYETLVGGDEDPEGGQARTIYWDYTGQTQLYAEEGNVIDIPSGGSTPGEGFLLPTFYNIGGAQRINVQIDLGGLRHNYLYPYGQRGFELAENNLYGCVDGADTGTVNVEGGNGLTDLSVSRGVWGSRITTAMLSPLKLQLSFTDSNGQTVTQARNVGWDSYVCVLTTGPQASLSHTFTYDQNGLYLMSLPLQPQTSDFSAVLGIPLSQLLLAWWDPWYAGENKYRLYPSFPAQGLGSAYWLRVVEDVTVELTGIRPDPKKTYEVALGGGWNLLGCPRTQSVTLAEVQVRRGDLDPVTWEEAVNANLLQHGVYAYNQTTGYEDADTLEPWRGYWTRVLVPTGVTLIFPATTTTAGVAR